MYNRDDMASMMDTYGDAYGDEDFDEDMDSSYASAGSEDVLDTDAAASAVDASDFEF